ncbi:uncharacterized protein LOC134711037 [Mytilus trossulus]|uniref:uncharacterized protein LOC134711037 n=1 Tax=Mytilus trossulus TaxID=6551 RepID=UPI0030049A22
MFGKNLDVDIGRGLLLYIDKQLDASQVHMNTEFQENLFIKINLNQSDQLLLGLIYRSPSNRSQEYTKQLNLLTTEACKKGYSHILIMGDYNYPEINWDSWNSPGDSTESNEYRFLENLQENFLFQHVTRPTRWRGTNTPHTLDLILTNEENMVSNLEYQSPLGKSDHCTMKFDFNCYTNINSKPKLIKLFSKGNYIKIKEELNKIKWPELLQKENDINENWKSVLSIIQDMDKKYIPTKERKQIGRGENKFPMDKNTIDKIKRKNILSKKITHNNDPEVRKEYNKIRNQVKSKVNKLKREYEKNLSQKAKENPKAIWSYIKSKTKTKEGIGDLHLDTEDTKSDKTEDNSKKAKLLVEYFSSVFTKEPDGEVPSPTPVLVINDMPYKKIKEEVVLKHLNALKIDKSPGMDKLHPRLLKEIAESLAKPLCIIYNQSLERRSTGLQLLEVIDKWTEALDQGLDIDCIYTDFMKAFDKVPYKRLIAKIKNLGVHEDIVGWITSFLEDRKQKVVVNGEESDCANVTSGIPQGSVLGPLLFVLYINDLPDQVDSDAYLFADDTKIFRIIKTQNDRQILQEDLNKMESWSDKWLLKFHPEKCKYMKISKKSNSTDHPPIYSLLNHPIAQVKEEKDIGVLIDAELTFENHISEKVNKANSIFAVLRRTFKYLGIETFMPLYKTMVRTHLDYASSVWSPYKKKDIDKLEGVQRRVTKQLPGLKDMSYPERLKKLGLPTLSYRRIRGDMIETFKTMNGYYDKEVSSFLRKADDSQQRCSSRTNSNKVVHQRFQSNIRKHSFSVRIAKTWNKLPDKITKSPSINAFKNRLDKYWSEKNYTIMTIEQKYPEVTVKIV